VLQSIRAGHWQKNGWQKNEVGADVSSSPKQRLDRLTIFCPPFFCLVLHIPSSDFSANDISAVGFSAG
jgi:hypothetical protein